MPRGGRRPGAGGKPEWIHGKTKVIRVPEALADKILVIARMLDEGKSLDNVTGSKMIDLSGISVRQHDGIIAIHLEDLVRAGYQIRPENLSKLVEARIQKLSIDKRLKYGNNPKI